MESTDEDLMKSFRLGDYEAFEMIYRRHAAKIYGALVAELGSTKAADEAFQKLFLKIHQMRSKFDDSFSFDSWVGVVGQSALGLEPSFFEESLKGNSSSEPARVLSLAILSKVLFDLNPTKLYVSIKSSGIVFVVATLGLLLVPQFGVYPHLANRIPEFVKGFFFLAVPAAVLARTLRPEETRVFRRMMIPAFFFYSFFSMAVLSKLGHRMPWDSLLLWLCGSVLGGLGVFEALYRLIRVKNS